MGWNVTGKRVEYVLNHLFGQDRRFSISYGSTRTLDDEAVIEAGWMDVSSAVFIYKGRGKYKAWTIWKPPIPISYERKSSAISVSEARKFLKSVGVEVPAHISDPADGAMTVVIKSQYITEKYYVHKLSKSPWIKVYSRRYSENSAQELSLISAKKFADDYFDKEHTVQKPLPKDMEESLKKLHMLAGV